MHVVTGQYSVVQDDEVETYSHKVYEPNGKDYIGPNMTETQAEIIAFALNAVASGATLYWGFAVNEVLTAYDGPTEGIRS